MHMTKIETGAKEPKTALVFLGGSLILVALAIPLASFAGATGHDSTQSAREATSDLLQVDLTRRGEPSANFTLSFAGDHGCSAIATHGGANEYKLEVCRVPDPGALPLLSFRVECDQENADHKLEVRKFDVSSRVAHSKKFVIARYGDRPDGDLTLTAELVSPAER
jgi:hypothetical protein